METESYIHVFARNCTARRIDKVTAKEFIDKYHRMGFSSCRYCYGLYVEKPGRSGLPQGTLVAVATFSSGRNLLMDGVTVRSYEWIRYASLEGTRVAGGMCKVMKAFIDDVNPDDIMTYVDPSWSDGESYRLLGFKEDGVKIFPDGKSSVKLRLRLSSPNPPQL